MPVLCSLPCCITHSLFQWLCLSFPLFFTTIFLYPFSLHHLFFSLHDMNAVPFFFTVNQNLLFSCSMSLSLSLYLYFSLLLTLSCSLKTCACTTLFFTLHCTNALPHILFFLFHCTIFFQPRCLSVSLSVSLAVSHNHTVIILCMPIEMF